MFSVPAFDSHCAAQVNKLVVQDAPLILRRGEFFPLDRIVITAFDTLGRIVPAAPIRLDAEATTPESVDLRADALADAVRPGPGHAQCTLESSVARLSSPLATRLRQAANRSSSGSYSGDAISKSDRTL